MLLMAKKILKFHHAGGCISLGLNGFFFFFHLFLFSDMLRFYLNYFPVLLSYSTTSSNLHWKEIHITFVYLPYLYIHTCIYMCIYIHPCVYMCIYIYINKCFLKKVILEERVLILCQHCSAADITLV